MNKITRKQYRINRNAFVGVEQEIFMYSIRCKSIYSVKQRLKKYQKGNKFIKPIKIKKGFSLRKVC